MWKKTLVLSSIVVVGIGYLLHVPSPGEHEYPTLVKMSFSLDKLIGVVGMMLEKFGFSYWGPMKFIMSLDSGFRLDGITVKVEELRGIQVTFFEPEGYAQRSAGPAMIYFYGGGWTTGSISASAPYLSRMAKDMDILIASPSYRQAPEYPFPIPFEDCLHVTEEFMKRASEFHVNPNKIVLSGGSAGGNLAAAVSLALNDVTTRNDALKICMINLIFPILQITDLTLPSYRQNSNAPLLTSKTMVRYFLTYIGLETHTELIEPMLNNAHMEGFEDEEIFKRVSPSWIPDKYKNVKNSGPLKSEYTSKQKQSLKKYREEIQKISANPYFAPLTVSDSRLRGLPKLHIVTNEYDVLRDDGIILYERMKSLGLEVSHQHLSFGIHGLFIFYKSFSYEMLENELHHMFKTIKDTVAEC